MDQAIAIQAPGNDRHSTDNTGSVIDRRSSSRRMNRVYGVANNTNNGVSNSNSATKIDSAAMVTSQTSAL